MNAPVPAASRDAEHLRLLAIFHYIFGSLAFLGLGFLVLHYLMMRAVMAPEMFAQSPNPPPPDFVAMFGWVYVLFGALMILGAALNLLAGNALRKRRARLFCMVVAGLNCLQVPLGTTLGVFTLVVLNQESVRKLFDGSGSATETGRG